MDAGGRGTGVVISGELDDCERESAPREFSSVGAKYQSCRLQGGTAKIEVAGAEYDEDSYKDNPIVWTP
ncbi:hypothetical protein [Actinokineospora iranica]|uniref:Uncharacterized protein n=1 Tax=Actinokineospora iranica TaxID=1271860 RepID=A0A1G6XHP1_9PSEU|nr:hypothetical protein [Actinokineospora iranica]SDD76827.1 hypothetical protein SAMN05216174_11777 [Actinokineospora iranica]